MGKSRLINLILGNKLQLEIIILSLGCFLQIEILSITKTAWGYAISLINHSNSYKTTETINLINQTSATNPDLLDCNNCNILILIEEFINPNIETNNLIIVTRLVYENTRINTNQEINNKLNQYFYENKTWEGPIIIEDESNQINETNNKNKLKYQIQGYLASVPKTPIIEYVLNKTELSLNSVVLSNKATINQQIKLIKRLIESVLG